MEELLSKETYRKFRFFLKKNKVYDYFMECFIKQPYGSYNITFLQSLHIANYIKHMNKMMKIVNIERYGALELAMRSFSWAGVTNKEFNIFWCTIAAKWMVFCLKNNIKICNMKECNRILNYWYSKNWVDKKKFNFEENIILNNIERYDT